MKKKSLFREEENLGQEGVIKLLFRIKEASCVFSRK